MTRSWARTAIVASLLLALVGACSSGDSAPRTTLPVVTTTTEVTTTTRVESSDVGVTKDALRVGVLVADHDRLRAAGMDLPAGLTTAASLARFTTYVDRWNAAGGGRRVVAVPIPWDPSDPRSYDAACTRAVGELKVFLVVNAAGFSPERVPCIAVDGRTPVLSGEPLGLTTYKDASGSLFGLMPPVELVAQTAVTAAVRSGQLPRTAVVGVLRGNHQTQLEAWERARKALEQSGVKVAFADPLNTASSTTAQVQAEVRQTVARMRQVGVTHVLVMLPMSQASAFVTNAAVTGSTFRYLQIETTGHDCAPLAATKNPAELDGAVCYTASDLARVSDKGVVQRDTELEAQCRRDYEAATGVKTTPGVPVGGVKQGDVAIEGDMPYLECSLASIVKAGLDKAGANPTRKGFADALASLREVALAGVSGGKGSFGADKAWAATQVHALVFRSVRPDAPRGADGLYGGCPSPRSCYLVTGDWVALEK